jgi:hypothetical protein
VTVTLSLSTLFVPKLEEFTLAFPDWLRKRTVEPLRAIAFDKYGHREIIFSIELTGDRKFCKVVREAILILKEKNQEALIVINEHVGFIIQSSKPSSLCPSETGGMLALLEEREAKGTSKTWLACLLAYEAYRSKMYQEYSVGHKQSFKVPEAVYSGDKAWDFMYECLKKIGGTYEEIQHLANFIKEKEEREGLKKEEG